MGDNKNINRKAVIYNEIIIQQWQDHIHRVFNDFVDMGTCESLSFEGDDQRQPESCFHNDVTTEEIMRGIRNVLCGESAGLDRIVSEMLTNDIVNITDHLLVLLNRLYDTSTFSSKWSFSAIVPIFPKKELQTTYRGKALTSIVSKVYTYILNRKLIIYRQRRRRK